MNELTINQPKGIGAFGWGFLGFAGSNIIFNIVFQLTLALIYDLDDIYGLLVFPALAFAIWLVIAFRNGREYQATRTGVNVSIFFNCAAFVIGFLGELL